MVEHGVEHGRHARHDGRLASWSMSFRASSSTKRGMMMISAAMAIAKFITPVIANTWKKGSAAEDALLAVAQVRAPRPSPAGTLMETLAWVSIAPLGVPVVPPVYCRTAISSMGSMSPASRQAVVLATGRRRR